MLDQFFLPNLLISFIIILHKRSKLMNIYYIILKVKKYLYSFANNLNAELSALNITTILRNKRFVYLHWIVAIHMIKIPFFIWLFGPYEKYGTSHAIQRKHNFTKMRATIYINKSVLIYLFDFCSFFRECFYRSRSRSSLCSWIQLPFHSM